MNNKVLLNFKLLIIPFLLFSLSSDKVMAQKAEELKLPFLIVNESLSINFSPDGKEVFFTIPYRDKRRSYISYARNENGRWNVQPKSFLTSGEFQETMPEFSNDGKKIIYFTNRPFEGKKGNDLDAWLSEKKKNQWSEPKPWKEINSDSVEYFGSFSKKGNFYFTSNRKGGIGNLDIWKYSTKTNQLENLGTPINSTKLNSIPCISPKEDYIIFFSDSKIEDDYGSGDLYISFRKQNKWSIPQNLGASVNTEHFELSPTLSVDGKRFYFVRATKRNGNTPIEWNYNIYTILVKDLPIKELRKKAVYE